MVSQRSSREAICVRAGPRAGVALLLLTLVLAPTAANADLIVIPITAFTGTENVARFEVSSRQQLPYYENGARFVSYSGMFVNLGSPNFLGLAGDGVLRVEFASPVTRVGFRLGVEVTPHVEVRAQAFMDPDFAATRPIGEVAIGSFNQFSRTDVAVQSDAPFTRLDLAFKVGTPRGSFWLDDFRFDATPAPDTDGDTLPDFWESRYGLDPNSAAGADGADGDPDQDGQPNDLELEDRTHPKGLFRRFFAEGATGSLFDAQLALLNPNVIGDAHVLLQFQTREGITVPHSMLVLAENLAPGGSGTGPRPQRQTVEVETLLGLTSAEFATIVESDVPLLADRTMAWDDRHYGAHAETSIEGSSLEWYLAEGATHSGFQLFYLLLNPRPTDAHVEVEYLLPSPRAPVVKPYVVPANSRLTLWVNTEPELASTDVSATILSTSDIIVERAMYRDAPGEFFGMGHASAGIKEPAIDWFLAEGATGKYFDTFVLIANPMEQSADLTATFLLPDGSEVERRLTVDGKSRRNIWVDQEDPALADTAVSTIIHSNNGVPVLVERAMWWPGPTWLTWTEGHDSAGATSTGTLWGVAEGEEGGPNAIETYLLVANNSDHDGLAEVTLLLETGMKLVKRYPLKPKSRTNVPVGAPEDVGGFGDAVRLQRFGALVESLPMNGNPAAQIVVERAMYWNADGMRWAAGTNALAAKLR